MTPAQIKARELVEKFKRHAYSGGLNNEFITGEESELHHAKQCALICVDEILNWMYDSFNTNPISIKFWQSVKKEIELL